MEATSSLVLVAVLTCCVTGFYIGDDSKRKVQYFDSSYLQDNKRSENPPWFRTSTEDCLISLGPAALPKEDGIYCEAMWDGVLCWPSAHAGHVIMQHCPPMRGLDPSKWAFRRCGHEGMWEGRFEGVSSPKGWTNYTGCYRPETLVIYNKLFGNKVPTNF